VALQVPEDSLDAYPKDWDSAPYLGQRGYLPHPAPRAAYAAMISRFDRDVGRVMSLLDELGLDERTLVLFTSDNGPTFNGGSDSEFFRSAGPLRGLKGSVFEGGIRVPLIARWPGRIEAGGVSDHVCAFWDLLPTILELSGIAVPDALDGIPFAAELTGRSGEQRRHELLYWELGRQQAVRAGPWKLVRRTNREGSTTAMLFNLDEDVGEQKDLADTRPEMLERMVELARNARTESEEFPSVYDDGR
jgi:arylsulfatase